MDQPALARSLRPRHVSMIAIGGIIGAGLFVGSSTAIATAGPAILGSYALAGLVILLVMRMLSEMAVLRPGAGAFTEFARVGLGDWAGFTAGWLYWYFWVLVVAVEAIAGAIILSGWIALAVWQIGVVLLAAMTGVNLLSTRSYGEFEFWFSSIKVAAIVAFILLTAGYLAGSGEARQSVPSNLFGHGGLAPHGLLAVLAGVTSVIFALCGAEIATVAAAESADPARTVARLTGSVALRILLFYLLSIALILCVVAWTDIRPGISPFATALQRIGIPAAATIMNLIVLVAVLSCLNSGLYVTSRMLFTLAGRGDAPRALAAIDRRGVPLRSILLGSTAGYVALAASVISPQRVFSFLVNASGATMLIVYLMVALAQLRLRSEAERKGEDIPIRMWFHPWASRATIAAMLAVLLAMALTPGLMSQFYSSVALAGLVLAVHWLRRSGAARRSKSGAT